MFLIAANGYYLRYNMTAIHRKKLFFNFSSLSLIQVISAVFSVVVIPYAIRRIGVENFAVTAVAQVVMFYLSVVTDYGFGQTATREIALNAGNTKKISEVFSSVLLTKFLLAVICFGILLLLCSVIPIFRQHIYLYLLAFAFVLGQVLLVNWFFQGHEKMHLIAIFNLAGRTIFLVLVISFIKSPADTPLYLFFMGLGNMIAGVVSIIYAITTGGIGYTAPSVKEIKSELKNGWQIMLANLSITTSQYSGLFILRFFTNDLIVGYYSIAEKIFFAMKLMLGAFTQAVYPRVCQLIEEKKKQLILFFRQIYFPFLLVVFLAVAIVSAFAGQITHLFMGSHHHQMAAMLLRLLCVAVFLSALNIPGNLILFAADHKKSYFRVFALSCIVNIVLNIVLASLFTATGTAIAVMITELFVAAGLSWEVYKLYSLKPRTAIKKIVNG